MSFHRLEVVFSDVDSAVKAARQVKGSSFFVRSLSWREEASLDGHPIVILSIIVRSEDAAPVSEFVAKKHPMQDPEISFVSVSFSSPSSFLQEKPAKTAFSTPLNNSVISVASADSLKNQYHSARFFPHMRIDNAFNQELLEDVYDALAAGGNFETRANDLYLFSQSEDLRMLGQRHPRISELAEALYSEQMIAFLSRLTGIELNRQVDMSATLYTNGCHLLCHDDRNETRRIAFILYLTPKMWSEKDGGALRFFGSDPKNFSMPNPHVFEDFLPIWGTFAFFTVGPNSFHTVREVTSQVDCKKGTFCLKETFCFTLFFFKLPRVAISGWFHGSELSVPQLLPVLFPKLECSPNLSKSPNFAINPM